MDNNNNENQKNSKLNPTEYAVLYNKETEAPFSGKYLNTKEKGMYHCKGCGAKLFDSETKFDSGTGWPSFSDVVSGEHVILKKDNSLNMSRTEVLCKKCDGHLGHVFDDGPSKTKKRYCINSCVLELKPNT